MLRSRLADERYDRSQPRLGMENFHVSRIRCLAFRIQSQTNLQGSPHAKRKINLRFYTSLSRVQQKYTQQNYLYVAIWAQQPAHQSADKPRK